MISYEKDKSKQVTSCSEIIMIFFFFTHFYGALDRQMARIGGLKG